jgi:hypothetical protein
MLIVAKRMNRITALKEQLSSEFDMKDLGVAKKILGMEIIREKEKLYWARKIILRRFFVTSIWIMRSLWALP